MPPKILPVLCLYTMALTMSEEPVTAYSRATGRIASDRLSSFDFFQGGKFLPRERTQNEPIRAQLVAGIKMFARLRFD